MYERSREKVYQKHKDSKWKCSKSQKTSQIMFDLLEKKRKRFSWGQKEKRKTLGRIKKERIIRARGQETVKKIAIYYVSVWPVFSLHGYETGNGRLTSKVTLKIFNSKH